MEWLNWINQDDNKENRAAAVPAAAPPTRRFLDPQPGATRVQWDDDDDTQSDPPGYEQQQRGYDVRANGAPDSGGGDNEPYSLPLEARKGKGKKRAAREDEEEDEDEDEAGVFAQDARNENEDRRKRLRRSPPRPRAAQQPPHQRRQQHQRQERLQRQRQPSQQREQQLGASDARRSGSLASGPLSSSRASAASLQSGGDDEGRGTLVQQLKYVDQVYQTHKPRQQRRAKNPWTDEQAQRLVDLIGVYGPEWKVLVNVGVFFPFRGDGC